METKVPVCLKMPLRRKTVNHFLARRQSRLPWLAAELDKHSRLLLGACGAHLYQVLRGYF